VVHFAGRATGWLASTTICVGISSVDGDTTWVRTWLEQQVAGFVCRDIDIRNRSGVLAAVEEIHPDAVVHCAAQPSHDSAARMPFDDFDTNAVGTLNLLESVRRHVPEAPFVFMSTNKVYGDAQSTRARRVAQALGLRRTRWQHGIPETSRLINRCTACSARARWRGPPLSGVRRYFG